MPKAEIDEGAVEDAYPDEVVLDIPGAAHPVVVSGLQGVSYKGWMDGKRLRWRFAKGIEVPRTGARPAYVRFSAFPFGFPRILVDGVEAARVPRPPAGFYWVQALLFVVPFLGLRAPFAAFVGILAVFGATSLFKRSDIGPGLRWGVPIAGVAVEIALVVLLTMAAIAARG